jgi:hypothetical protein
LPKDTQDQGAKQANQAFCAGIADAGSLVQRVGQRRDGTATHERREHAEAGVDHIILRRRTGGIGDSRQDAWWLLSDGLGELCRASWLSNQGCEGRKYRGDPPGDGLFEGHRIDVEPR